MTNLFNLPLLLLLFVSLPSLSQAQSVEEMARERREIETQKDELKRKIVHEKARLQAYDFLNGAYLQGVKHREVMKSAFRTIAVAAENVQVIQPPEVESLGAEEAKQWTQKLHTAAFGFAEEEHKATTALERYRRSLSSMEAQCRIVLETNADRLVDAIPPEYSQDLQYGYKPSLAGAISWLKSHGFSPLVDYCEKLRQPLPQVEQAYGRIFEQYGETLEKYLDHTSEVLAHGMYKDFQERLAHAEVSLDAYYDAENVLVELEQQFQDALLLHYRYFEALRRLEVLQTGSLILLNALLSLDLREKEAKKAKELAVEWTAKVKKYRRLVTKNPPSYWIQKRIRKLEKSGRVLPAELEQAKALLLYAEIANEDSHGTYAAFAELALNKLEED